MILLALLLQAAPAAPPPATVPAGAGMPAASVVVEPVGMMIATFDTDMSGGTSKAELVEGVRRSFRAIDTADSGRLGYIVFADWAERWLGNRTALPSPFEVDVDGDNQITLVELEANFARTFDRLDKDHDGIVTRAETLTIRSLIGPVDSGRGRKGRR